MSWLLFEGSVHSEDYEFLELCLWKGNTVKYIRINDTVRHVKWQCVMPDNIWQCVAHLYLECLFGHVLCLLTISQGELYSNSAWETPLLFTALLTQESTWVGIISSFSLRSHFPIRCEGKCRKKCLYLDLMEMWFKVA